MTKRNTVQIYLPAKHVMNKALNNAIEELKKYKKECENRGQILPEYYKQAQETTIKNMEEIKNILLGTNIKISSSKL